MNTAIDRRDHEVIFMNKRYKVVHRSDGQSFTIYDSGGNVVITTFNSHLENYPDYWDIELGVQPNVVKLMLHAYHKGMEDERRKPRKED